METRSTGASQGRAPHRPSTLVVALLVAFGVAAGCSDEGEVATAAATTTTTDATGTSTTSDAVPTASTTTTTIDPDGRTGGPTIVRDGTETDAWDPPTIEPATTDPVPTDPFATPGYRLHMAASQGDGTRALGSGCTVSSSDALPDGLWYGHVERLEDGVVTVDLACFWVGDLSTVAGCEDWAELSSCVLDESDRLRTVRLARDALFHLPRRHEPDGNLVNDEADFEQFAVWLGHRPNTLAAWMQVRDGLLVEFEAEQLVAG